MLHQVIKASGQEAVEGISASCSEVTLGCSDVSGLVQSVLTSSEKLRAEHTALLGTVAASLRFVDTARKRTPPC